MKLKFWVKESSWQEVIEQLKMEMLFEAMRLEELRIKNKEIVGAR